MTPSLPPSSFVTVNRQLSTLCNYTPDRVMKSWRLATGPTLLLPIPANPMANSVPPPPPPRKHDRETRRALSSPLGPGDSYAKVMQVRDMTRQGSRLGTGSGRLTARPPFLVTSTAHVAL
ncbi:hypothetical protein SKAU_G00106320 [Synaphobranchus kaupii]|uniref:Uncharacterized protein n=1 Tax=Synaphobranchus kaupii TaxID=118154 RepID=A0A9Q1G081_SYNKA|nr:hypothetical protein SKAU_G00106320 [Synaphobranchus kaupii]